MCVYSICGVNHIFTIEEFIVRVQTKDRLFSSVYSTLQEECRGCVEGWVARNERSDAAKGLMWVSLVSQGYCEQTGLLTHVSYMVAAVAGIIHRHVCRYLHNAAHHSVLASNSAENRHNYHSRESDCAQTCSGVQRWYAVSLVSVEFSY